MTFEPPPASKELFCRDHGCSYISTERDGVPFHYCQRKFERFYRFVDIAKIFHPDFVQSLLGALKKQSQRSERLCPHCARPMYALKCRDHESEFFIDYCMNDDAVLLDQNELKRFPLVNAPTSAHFCESIHETTLSPSMEIDFQHAELKDVILADLAPSMRDSNPHAKKEFPLLTFILILLLILAHIIFSGTNTWEKMFRFSRVDPLANLGVPWIGSFFVHGNWAHLLGNLYFLYTFGDDVESYLGRLRYVELLCFSTIMSCLGFWILGSPSAVYLIGASGGIAGALFFYILTFPKAKITFVKPLYFSSFRQGPYASMNRSGGILTTKVSAFMFGFYYLLMQFALNQTLEKNSMGQIAFSAHLGGILGAFLFWAWIGSPRAKHGGGQQTNTVSR